MHRVAGFSDSNDKLPDNNGRVNDIVASTNCSHYVIHIYIEQQERYKSVAGKKLKMQNLDL